MSRIGKQPVTIPQGVEVTIEPTLLRVKGSKGELTQSYEPEYVSFAQEGGTLTVTRKNDTKPARARHGLYRNLAQNLVVGVTDGFEKKLEVRGVGYRVAQKGNALEFQLGYSHPVSFPLPEGVSVEFEKDNANIFTLKSSDKQLVGQVAANIRALRKPEPYKGKGIRYFGETIVLKAGKSAAKK